MLFVMFFLTGNIFCHRPDIRFADAEYSVSGLPGEIWTPFFTNPTRGIRLDHERFPRRNEQGGYESVHERIGGAVDDQGGSAYFADDASEVVKQILAELWLDEWTPALCAENHMQQNVGRCMRQNLSPRWGSPFVVADPRLAPWAAFFRRFAASLISRLP